MPIQTLQDEGTEGGKRQIQTQRGRIERDREKTQRMRQIKKERPRLANRDRCSTTARLRQRQTEEKTGR
jgi:hypothetical protein